MIEALRQDLRYGLRVLSRARGFTAAVVITLALGMGANTAIFTVLDAVLLRPLPYPQPDRLVTVGDATPDGLSSNVGFTTVSDWRARSRTFEHVALMRSWQPTLVVNGEAERLPAVRVSWNYFAMMGVRPALGRDFTADEDRPDQWRVVLLSDALWRRRFGGDPSVVGRAIVMNDREYRVIGVLPSTFEPLDAARYYAAAELWAPIGYDVSMRDACRSCRHLRAFGRLKAGVTVDEATAEMNGIREQLRREHPGDYEAGAIAVVPLLEAIAGHVRPALQVLMAAVGFVLLIACANVANLLVARSLARQREFALRGALGAGRSRIVRQLLTESTLLTLGGAVVGLALAAVALEGVAAVAPVSLPRLDRAALDTRVLAFSALLVAVTATVFGLVPAWRSSRVDPQSGLGIDARGTVRGTSTGRSALVVTDLALALVLLACAGLMLKTVVALTRASPGFDASRVLTLQFSLVGKAYAEDAAVVSFQERFLERARALPDVTAVALAGQVPFGGDFDCWGFHAKGRMKPNPVDDPCIQRYGATPEYLRVMGIPIRAGRFFNDHDVAASQPVIVISEGTAKTVWGSKNPIGSEVRIGDADRGDWRTVIGVVADAHHEDVAAPPMAAMYTPQTQLTDSFLVAVARSATSESAGLATPMRTIVRELDPTVPVYAIAPLEELVARASAHRVFVMRLLTAFGVLALLLAAVGLYGVVSHGVSERTRELGVRVALGARPTDIVRLVLGHGAALVAAGIGIGVLAVFGATRYLRALMFGVTPLDAQTLAIAAVLLVAIAFLAHVIPVRRALRVDPVVALRDE